MASLTPPAATIILISVLYYLYPLQALHQDETAIYIVHVDPEGMNSHHELLTVILGSPEAAKESLVYSYEYGFLGFAAWMTHAEARQMQQYPGVLKVFADRRYTVRTTRSWDFLGLSYGQNELLQDTRMGEDSIIGVIDTGIWPESQAFNDTGLGGIPSRWNGSCVSGEDFDAPLLCNKKLIGSIWFDQSIQNISISRDDYHSARDSDGHGTHVSSTAAGSFVPDASDSHLGLAFGNMRGGAPGARIAMYKVCWRFDVWPTQPQPFCGSSDILQGFTKAIMDGVDVISISLGSEEGNVDEIGPIFSGSLHAVSKGITVVCAAGNSGPFGYTVDNTMPWVITVAASSIDRSFPTKITLEHHNKTILAGRSVYTGREIKGTELVVPNDLMSICKGDQSGKIILLMNGLQTEKLAANNSCAGIIYVASPSGGSYTELPQFVFPIVQVDHETGFQILKYITSSRCPRASISRMETLVDSRISTKIPRFSSRGPNPYTPEILKPDVAAPGVQILAGYRGSSKVREGPGEFKLLSGTSMATPHVSGVVALLRSLHPGWSPAAIKSAIVTTASVEAIFAERKLADPFDYGGGIINPNGAADPGLVYDIVTGDYFRYLCSAGFNVSSLAVPPQRYPVCQDHESFTALDLNLPSITIPSLGDSIVVRRSVTNVGPYDFSKYWVTVDPPQGINVEVFPMLLVFTTKGQTISFEVRMTTTHTVETAYLFGSLTWNDGLHTVRIPLSVRTQLLENYVDDN